MPEVTQQEDFLPTVTSIFNTLFGRPNTNPNNMYIGSRNVVCRVCSFKQKEAILSKAWKKGIVDFDDVRINSAPTNTTMIICENKLLPLKSEITPNGMCSGVGGASDSTLK